MFGYLQCWVMNNSLQCVTMSSVLAWVQVSQITDITYIVLSCKVNTPKLLVMSDIVSCMTSASKLTNI